MRKVFKIVWISLILLACEKSTEPQQGNGTKLFPLEVGSYWIYSGYEKDYNNNIIHSSIVEDSVVIESASSLANSMAYYFVRYRNANRFDTLIFTYRDNKIYRMFDSNTIPIPGLQITWFPVIDLKSSKNISYNVYKELIGNYSVSDEGREYFANYWHTINGEYTYLDSLDFENKKYLTKIFTNKYDSKLEYKKLRKLTETSYDTLLVNRLMKYFDKYQLLEGIGLFKLQRDSYAINTITEPSSTFEKVELVKE